MPRRKDTGIYSYKLKSRKTKYGFKTYIGTETGKAKLLVKALLHVKNLNKPRLRSK